MIRVLVTRPDGHGEALADRLVRAGISVASVPCVAVEPPAEADVARLRTLLATADWIVITSVNGVPALRAALHGQPLPTDVRLAAVGPATADARERSGLYVSAMPPRFLTAAIADTLGDVAGRRVILARAEAATPDLNHALLARGASVVEVPAYRTVEGPPASRAAVQQVLERPLDGILFTSGSTVRGLLALVPSRTRRAVRRVPAFCIGPVAAAAARDRGFPVAAVADRHTAGGLADATIKYFHEVAS